MSLTTMPPSISSIIEPPVTASRAESGLVDIVSGSFGEGHDAAAREIARRLGARGYTTRMWDIVDLMPGHLGRALKEGYLHQIQSLPATWAWTLQALERHPSLARLAIRGLGAADTALLSVAADRPDSIISTHPFASQALGRLRGQGLIDSPVVTYLTDMSVHPLWVNPSVDLHVAIHELPAGEARARGARETVVVRPVVPEAFSSPLSSRPSQSQARLKSGLPLSERLVLVTGGSCGIGDLQKTAQEIAATGLAVPVVLCGHNERLLRRIDTDGSAIALGWIDDMPTLLDAVDAVVQNAGGFTSLEALAAGVPILTYRCISGHGETNAQALDQAGLVPWIRDRTDLATSLMVALTNVPSREGPVSWRDRRDLVDALVSRVGATA